MARLQRSQSKRSQSDPDQGGTHGYTDAARGVRLQKVMADAGVAARRECEQLIEAGRVKVNGDTVRHLPAWVDPQRDRISVDGEPIARPRRIKTRSSEGTQVRSAPRQGVYIMLHKPRRVISTTDDPEGRRSVLDLLPPELTAGHRLYPVGRLDADTSGLVLLTNDGELANRLTHPRFGIAKQYRVTVRGQVEEADVERLKRGLHLAERVGGRTTQRGSRRAAVADVQVLRREQDRTHGDRTSLLITLREGQNREIRRLLARLGFNVRRLERVAIGPLRLKGLASGQWRRLSRDELARLKDEVNHRSPATPDQGAAQKRSGRDQRGSH